MISQKINAPNIPLCVLMYGIWKGPSGLVMSRHDGACSQKGKKWLRLVFMQDVRGVSFCVLLGFQSIGMACLIKVIVAFVPLEAIVIFFGLPKGPTDEHSTAMELIILVSVEKGYARAWRASKSFSHAFSFEVIFTPL